jgi:hypothetical protein
LSFLFAGAADSAKAADLAAAPSPAQAGSSEVPLRIISDAFPVPPGRQGRYGCSAKGLILATGSRQTVEKLPSGALVNMVLKGKDKLDPKSGAIAVAVE